MKLENVHQNTEKTNSNNQDNKIKSAKEENINDKLKSEIWQIKIPKINLVAPIKDGTNQEVLDEFVGHFEETAKQIGNIGLAAHNRGYNVNYFEKIKLLEIGDEIYYLYKGIENRYIVVFKEIIEDTNWDYLKYTNDNRITLITCVEGQSQHRLCVQAIQK